MSLRQAKTTIMPVVAKKMLKNNKDVGKFRKGVPDLIVSTAELFIIDMIKQLIESNPQAEEITAQNVIDLIKSNKQYDFLLTSVDKIAACIADSASKKKKKPEEEA